MTIFREKDWQKIRTAVHNVWTDMVTAVRTDKENIAIGAFFALLFLIPFMLIASILFGVAFPLLHAYSYYSYHSGLQTFCFLGVAASLLLIVFMIPKVIKLIIFLIIAETFFGSIGSNECLQGVHIIVEEYFVPSSRQVLLSYVPLSLVPGDIVGVVAQFIQFRDLNMSAKRLKDYSSIRDEIGDM